MTVWCDNHRTSGIGECDVYCSSLALDGKPPGFAVQPTTDFHSQGIIGGPFDPSHDSYFLTNRSTTAPLNWILRHSEPWLTASPSAGTLGPGQSAEIALSVDYSARALPIGTYYDNIEIADTDTGTSTTRGARLQVLAWYGAALLYPGAYPTEVHVDPCAATDGKGHWVTAWSCAYLGTRPIPPEHLDFR